MSNKISYGLIIILFLTLLVTEACKENRTDNPEMKAYINSLIKERKEKDYSLISTLHLTATKQLYLIH